MELSLASADATIVALLSSTVDFSVIGLPLSTAQAAAHPNVTSLPVMAGAIVAVYRLDALNSSAPSLILSGRTLALIYAGNVTNWSDPLIQDDNPGVVLPNITISVGLQADARAYTTLFLRYLVKSEPSIAAILPPSELPDWPTYRYAASKGGFGPTGVMAYVVNTNGAIGFGIQQSAIPYDATVARLINRAGYTVEPTQSSIEYGMFELLTANNLTYFPDSTDPSSAYAWPLVSVQYLLLHSDYSPRGCEVRSALLAFWLWFYESVETYSSIAANYVMVAVPALIQQQLAITATLTSAITCNGRPLNATQSSATVSTVQMYAPNRLNQQLTAFSDFYTGTSNATNVNLLVDSATSDQSLNNANERLGLAFYYESEITTTSTTPLDTMDNYILPSFLTSIVYTYNQQLSSTITLNSSIQLLIDFNTVMRIITGNITDWHDPRLTALNPVLATALDNNPAPITFMFTCDPLQSPLYTAIGDIIGQATALDDDLSDAYFGALLNGIVAAFKSCSYLPNVRWQFATKEQSIAALVTNVAGAIGYAMDMNADGVGQFGLMYPLLVNGATVATTRTARRSTPDALLACASTGFDLHSLTIDIATAASHNTDCYPMTQVVYGQLPRVYAVEQGRVALATVRFLDWLYTEDELDTYAHSNMFVRTSNVATIQSALVTALQSVTTSDGNPLILQPINWTLTRAVSDVAVLLATVAAALTLVAMAITVRYSKDAVFRSSSPVLMVVSFVGLLCMCAALLCLTVPATRISCSSFTASVHIGFTLVFAPLFAKAYRIYCIFGRRRLKVVKLTNRRMLAAVLACVVADVVCMVIWQAVAAPSTVVLTRQETVYTAGESVEQQYDYVVCAFEGQSADFMRAIGAAKMASLVLGVMLAFSTRQVTSQFNESKLISLTIYNIVFAIGVIVPIYFVVDAVGDVNVILLLFCIGEILYFTLAALTIPKLLAFSAARRSVHVEQSVAGGSELDNTPLYSFLSFEQLSTPALLHPYIGAMERHLNEARRVLADMRRSGAHKPTHRATGSVVPSQPVTARASEVSHQSVTSSAQPSDHRAAHMLTPHSSQPQDASPHNRVGSSEQAWLSKRSSELSAVDTAEQATEQSHLAETATKDGAAVVGGGGEMEGEKKGAVVVVQQQVVVERASIATTVTGAEVAELERRLSVSDDCTTSRGREQSDT